MNAGKHRQLYRIIYYQLIQRHIFAITGFIRVIPDFLVIGAKRCGTTSLYQHLPEHPCISKSPHDNMGFFNDNFHLGVNWYKSFFPTTFTNLGVSWHLMLQLSIWKKNLLQTMFIKQSQT